MMSLTLEAYAATTGGEVVRATNDGKCAAYCTRCHAVNVMVWKSNANISNDDKQTIGFDTPLCKKCA